MQTWGVRGTITAMGIAAAIAGVGGVAVHAATAEGPHMGGPGFGGPGRGSQSGPGRPGAAPGANALHGEYTESTGSGAFVTKLSQTGRLTATSPTTLTVRSVDGYQTTYLLPPGAPAQTAGVGDDVTVRATRDGDSVVVQSIDRTDQGPSAPTG